MNKFNSIEHPHRRYNPLTGEWILVSPHRTQRPWMGQLEKLPPEKRPVYDPNCYLCPGNQRAGGLTNPQYDSTFVFTNDFSALLPETPPAELPTNELLRMQGVRGTCRVMCFSPRHDLTLAEMSPSEILTVINMWTEQAIELGERFRWVQIFENKGSIMGCSNPHPHGQIWALDTLPNEPAKEDHHQRSYFSEQRQPLLIDYLDQELQAGQRIVIENRHWLALVPYWAIWPFETLLLPRRHVLRLPDLQEVERSALAEILKRLLVRYDNLFETSFPYSMGWHGAPFSAQDSHHWQLHAHFYPPLLRSASVKKFMVGFEMLGEAQRDLTSEQAAERLRAISETHYREID